MTSKEKKDLDFLPEAMVQEMLQKQNQVIEQVENDMIQLGAAKKEVREKLVELGLLKNFAELVDLRSYPTTTGVDGTYSIIKQLSIDSVATAAVAVEGLVPPRETRFWEKPHHLLNVFPIMHFARTTELCRHLMFSYELELAAKAPHRVVFLDGSLTSQLIAIGQGLWAIDDARGGAPSTLSELIENRLGNTLENYLTVLTSLRVDKMFVGVPKYTSRTEIIRKLKNSNLNIPYLDRCDDKGLLSVVLNPGDVVGPVELEKPQSPWHITGISGQSRSQYLKVKNQIVDALNKLHVLYLKPTEIHPALRVEVAAGILGSRRRLSILLEGLHDQTAMPGVFEPYPLYIADMFVKHVHGGLLELREAALGELGRIKSVDVADFYLSLHDYRTERGFG